MRHKLSRRKLSRPTAHRRSMLRGAVTDLLRHESIQTTEAKAREISRLAEKAITRGKGGTLHDRRQAATMLTSESILKKLFDELGPRYEDRPGGYTRMVKMAPRRGDAAAMAVVALV